MSIADRGAVVTELDFGDRVDLALLRLGRNVNGCGRGRCGRGRTR